MSEHIDESDAPPELIAWFSENLTHERFRDWSDGQFAASLVADRSVMDALAKRVVA